MSTNVVDDHGAVGDGVTDDTAAFNAAISLGGTKIVVPSGKYLVTESLGLIDYSSSSSVSEDNDRIRIEGDGIGNTQIIFSGSGNLFQVAGGEAGNGNFAQFTIADIALTGSGAENQTGIYGNIAPYTILERVRIAGFGTAVSMINSDFVCIDKCQIRWNNRGIYAVETGESPFRTRPNSWSIRDSSIALNTEYAMYFYEPSTLLIDGCDIANNGQGTGGSRYAIKIHNSGAEGGGVNITNNYFEENKNIADLWLFGDSTNDVYQCAHTVIGNSFNRTGVGPHNPATCNILVQWPKWNGNRLTLIGNSFKAYDGYVNTWGGTTRYNCLFDSTGWQGDVGWNFHAFGNLQQWKRNIQHFTEGISGN